MDGGYFIGHRRFAFESLGTPFRKNSGISDLRVNIRIQDIYR